MREQDRDQIKSNWEMKEKFADEQRIKSEEQMRRTQEEMTLRMGKQEEELRRRQQENTLFMQVSGEMNAPRPSRLCSAVSCYDDTFFGPCL